MCAQLRDLRLENRSAMPNSDFSCVETRFSPGSRHCAGVFQTQVPKLCTHLDPRLLYILILGTYSKGYKCVQCRVCFDSSGHWCVKQESLKGCTGSSGEGHRSGNHVTMTSIMSTARQLDHLPTCHTKWNTNARVSTKPLIEDDRIDSNP